MAKDLYVEGVAHKSVAHGPPMCMGMSKNATALMSLFEELQRALQQSREVQGTLYHNQI